MEKRPMNILIPVDLYERFKECAEKEFKTVTSAVVDLMVEYVKKAEAFDIRVLAEHVEGKPWKIKEAITQLEAELAKFKSPDTTPTPSDFAEKPRTKKK